MKSHPILSLIPTFRFGMVAASAAACMLVTSILAKPKVAVAPTPPAALNGGAEYVGEAVCIACHAPQNNQFTHTVHAKAFRLNPRNEKEKLSCEACHGPGSNHLKDPANPANRVSLVGFTKSWGTPVAQQTAMCLSCHQGGQHTFWEGSVHATNNLSCSDCHNPMAKVSTTGLLKKQGINETCYSCHQQQRSEFAKRSHMPLPEGKLSCVDCHNPHGSTSKTLLKMDSVNETCYGCHTEKRGPFLWEHAPVKENCMSCHNAHGSNHEKLLQVARPFLCQQCHANAAGHQSVLFNASQIIGGGGTPNARMLGRSCQNCHSQIHGSNHPGGARFQR
ncbi:MAG: ammonia-forming cytochrome c nitrite reductase subunit c552 [Opitutaceae bacterium]|nr:ammonia-forming cytochrome c nitrite reductase subunit c552 [Opitutaceae bacterium]